MKEEISLEEIDSLIKNKKVLSINEDIEDKLLKITNEERISSVLKIDDGIDEVIL